MTTQEVPTFRLAPEAAGLVKASLSGAADVEPCGYLVGSVEAGRGWCADRAWVGTNVHPEPRFAFLLDPDEQLAVQARARARGLRVIGLWHGHLAGPARPSRADRAGHHPLAPDVMLLAAWEGGRIVLRAHARLEGRWREVPVEELREISDPPASPP